MHIFTSSGAHLLLLIFDHILSHLEGAQVLVHTLQLRVVGGVLVPVQQTVDGLVVVVNDAAVLLLVFTWTHRHTHTHTKLKYLTSQCLHAPVNLSHEALCPYISAVFSLSPSPSSLNSSSVPNLRMSSSSCLDMEPVLDPRPGRTTRWVSIIFFLATWMEEGAQTKESNLLIGHVKKWKSATGSFSNQFCFLASYENWFYMSPTKK